MSEHRGIHHISVTASDPQANYDFYVKKLGMRMVKKTVNQDDPTKYHLFYANAEGSPGSSLTFFPWPNAREGINGTGEATAISLAVPKDSLSYWQEHLKEQKIPFSGPISRYNKQHLSFKDPDGLQLHLVFDDLLSDPKGWEKSPVPTEHQIQGFWSTTLEVANTEHTENVLTSILGFEKDSSEKNATLYKSKSTLGKTIILKQTPARQGQNGAGIVHHLAFQTEDKEDLKKLRHEVLRYGLQPTEITDRHFFKSVYFRLPNGLLFEMATSGPGYFVNSDFDADQAEKLELPPWYRSQRDEIEAALPTLKT
ncbi:ring-cleaving dioxygenase [Fodinibius halophilus]|uniref:Ring-cleaving dioxygenase n=1 Tax=Fodinibius halophilus TaxID=1736908 RepID=A0A6M1SV49_9BACT|nr:ring-cleaving dioxygenase [Fodinibius halophilus]NGP87456.1 ring-cleaving dioxygenase [Fodinibius halophilus]